MGAAGGRAAALHHRGEIDLLGRKFHGLQHLGEELALGARERGSRAVFLCGRHVANKHDAGPLGALSKDQLGAGVAERTALAVAELSSERGLGGRSLRSGIARPVGGEGLAHRLGELLHAASNSLVRTGGGGSGSRGWRRAARWRGGERRLALWRRDLLLRGPLVGRGRARCSRPRRFATSQRGEAERRLPTEPRGEVAGQFLKQHLVRLNTAHRFLAKQLSAHATISAAISCFAAGPKETTAPAPS